MSTKNQNIGATPNHSDTDDKSWMTLCENVRALAVRKSGAMLDATKDGGEPEDFDASARTLRALMSAADIAQRMKRCERQELEPHDQTNQTPYLTDQAADAAYDLVKRTIDRAAGRAAGGTKNDVKQSEPGKPRRKDMGRDERRSAGDRAVSPDVSGAGRKEMDDQCP